MNIRELKERIKNVPEDAEVVVGSFFDDVKTIRYIECKINEVTKYVFQISREDEEND